MSGHLDNLLKAFSPQTREIIRAAWDTLPPDVRRSSDETLGAVTQLMSADPHAMTHVARSVKRMLDPLASPMARVAIVGPANVGKSTLYNALADHDPGDRAATSPVPGTTRAVQEANLGLFSLLDTPGADNAAEQGGEERTLALEAAAGADFLVIVLDATRGVLASEKALYTRLQILGHPHLVVLNKIDLVAPRQRAAVVAAAALTLGLDREAVVRTSATSGLGVDRLILEIAAAEPRLLGELGRHIPAMRRQLAWQAVRRAAATAALVGLAPLPIIDLVPLTAIQIGMFLTVARIYDRPVTLVRAGQALATFGGGLMARSLFAELTKLGGVPGWILAASVASSATAGMGYAAIVWFETGKRPPRAAVGQITRRLQQGLMARLRALGRRRPVRADLEQTLQEALPPVDPIYSPGNTGRHPS